jgi:hypothetical protein
LISPTSAERNDGVAVTLNFFALAGAACDSAVCVEGWSELAESGGGRATGSGTGTGTAIDRDTDGVTSATPASEQTTSRNVRGCLRLRIRSLL